MGTVANLSSIIDAAKPLGGVGGLVLVLVYVVLATRKNRSDEDRQLSISRADEIRNLRVRAETAEATALRESERGDRMKDAARWWNERAHRERHAHLNSLQIFALWLQTHAIEAPPIATPDPLPTFLEETA